MPSHSATSTPRTPPSCTRHLDAGRLQVHPAVINNGGETLTNQARALIEAAFGARVANGYGCSEMLMIAYDCGHGWLHVHAGWASLEPVDEQRRPVPVGSGRPPCC